MARYRRTDGRLFASPARISGWVVGLSFPLIMMTGYWIVAQIHCCTENTPSGSRAEWTGYAVMGTVFLLIGTGLALSVAALVEWIHRLVDRMRQ